MLQGKFIYSSSILYLKRHTAVNRAPAVSLLAITEQDSIGRADVFVFCTSLQTLEEQLRRLVVVVDAVCDDVQRGQNVYNKLFYR